MEEQQWYTSFGDNVYSGSSQENLDSSADNKTNQTSHTTSLAQVTNDTQSCSEGIAADSSDSDENIPLNRLRKIKKEP